MAQYIIPAVAAIVVALIEALAAWDRKKAKTEKAKAEQREKAREELLIHLVQNVTAAIALGEASARALQRGYTNGDTKAALEYAGKVKHQLKDFLSAQGIHAMLE